MTSTVQTTTGSPLPAPPRAVDQRRVTFPRVLTSEWVKFRSLRSSWAMLLAAAAGLVVIALIIAANTGSHRAGLDPEDTVLSATLQGYHLAELLMGILGVLFVSGEYSTGMVRSTMAAVPRRVPVLFAKAIVLGVVVGVAMAVATLVAFLSSEAVLARSGHGFSLSDPTGVRVVFGTALYLVLVALLGSAFGWVVRSTPGGISSLVGLLLVVPLLLSLFGDLGRTVAEYLPSPAGEAFAVSLRLPHTLSPTTGLVVLVLWVLAAMTTAAVLLKRRDA
ncbi:MAG: putative transporter transrane protein [Frankiales bacterium]|nr:putative transporter transrane protein [Frankiales bacterium]